jgi:hypothetical protein
VQALEHVAILCRLGKGQLPVLHGWDRHRAHVSGAGGMVPDEKVGEVEGMVERQARTSLSAGGGREMNGERRCLWNSQNDSHSALGKRSMWEGVSCLFLLYKWRWRDL